MNAPKFETGQLGAPLVVINQVEPQPGECLIPHPEGTTGHRLYHLATLVFRNRPGPALDMARWLTITERHTLCVGRWDAAEAARKATEVVAQAGERPMLALGRRVLLAIAGTDHLGNVEREGLYMIPHPSRRNRAWLVEDNVTAAIATLDRWMAAGGIWR